MSTILQLVCTLMMNGFVKTDPIPNEDVDRWCKENSIKYVYMGRHYAQEIWYIEDEEQRMLFALRWT